MTKPHTPIITYWANDNGAIICSDHAGNYLRSAIQAKPKAHKHSTPLGTYELLTDVEIADYQDYAGGKSICETCRFNSK